MSASSFLALHRSALLLLLLVFGVIFYPGAALAGPAAGPTPEGFRSGVVASAHPLASKAGLAVLEGGGNAVDAAVATAFALGVVEPNASGIGGGGFMLIYLAQSREVASIDYRETAPGAARADMFQKAPAAQKTGLRAVAVPGTVAGLALALRKYGTMDLARVLAPAIELAEKGFPLSKLLHSMIATNAGKLAKSPAAARIYLKRGRPYPVGQRLLQKDLAGTYRLLAAQGPDAFYKGALAEAIVKEMQGSGAGLITRGDLAAYLPVFRAPVTGTYRGYGIYSMGPPSSGGTHIIELLNILEGYDFAKLRLNSPLSIAIMAEALKKVFADREKYMGDPDFVKIPLEELLSKEHAEELRREIKVGRLTREAAQIGPARPESPQTTHLSVADKDGNLVALTETLNSFFGSGVVVPGTGIILNNQMADFDPEPGRPNSIEPWKRPLSSMSPTLVVHEGRPYLSIGMPGATRIISVLPQILIDMIDHGMTLQEAFDAPRIHCATGEIYLESRIPRTVRAALVRQGYHLSLKKDFDLYFGGAQGIVIDPGSGLLYGGADPRREGAVAGY